FRTTSGGDSRLPSVLDTLTLQLAYRPPFNWSALLAFLDARSTRGVDRVEGNGYLRTVSLRGLTGWVAVRHDARRRSLRVELSRELAPVLPALLARLRQLFDLDARPDIIRARLGADPRLAPLMEVDPGLRVPGAFDGFELAVRAILGQQVTVAAARTIAGRLVERFGDPVDTPDPRLGRLFPTPARLARASSDDLGRIGIVRQRQAAIVALARAVDAGEISLSPAGDPADIMRRLRALPGVGDWTAQYIAMRALHWPDAFPAGDIALQRALGLPRSRRAGIAAERASLAWQPWRSYAVLRAWHAPRPEASR